MRLNDLSVTINNFTTKAKLWNKEHFGNIFHRKKRASERLHGVQMVLANRPNNFLIDLEKSLRVELSEISKQEEEFWSMKARISWMVKGDRNTAFFHTLALVCRRRNHITKMKDRIRNWLNGERDIAEFIRQGFIDLFTTSRTSVLACEWQPPFWHCELKDVDRSTLERQISDREIFDALFSLKPYKAPGLDGLHAGFFQRFWLVVGELVKKEVKEIFCLGKVPLYFN